MARALPTPRWIAWTVASALVLVAALYAFHRLEQFLIRDVRFTLNEPTPGSESLEIAGSTHASAKAIQAVFAEDFGRSVYLIPISDRRDSLRNVDWIKDASVARFWPNRIVVGVSERKPVAFVTLESGRPALIDEEGVILPPAQDHFTLPVLLGVNASDPVPTRRERVQRLLSLMKDLGTAARSISEVDVSDPDNLKISEPMDGHSITLLMGDRNFAQRHQNFVGYFAEIRKKDPNASVLDMRLEDRITVVKEREDQKKVVK
ncbi:MAG TPA: FtsQ-type POTRA domain-containing protein [Bryobacteraceae bacterium]|jgi:cell division septal protein FtsQ